MGRKKRKSGQSDGPYNPYFGKAQDESHMPERPLFTWALAVPGLLLGVVIGLGTRQLVLGIVFGGIMGIAIGSMIDKWREKRTK